MKSLILKLLPVFFFGNLFFANAQFSSLPPINHYMEGHIDLAKDQLRIDSTSNSGLEATLKDGEIIFTFHLGKFQNKSIENIRKNLPGKLFFEVQLKLELDGVPIIPFEENLKGDLGEKIPLMEYSEKEIIWTNLVETYLQLEGVLKVRINTVIKGEFDFNCSNPPKFSTQQQLKYFVAAGAGVALIGVGQIFHNKSQKTYNDNYLPAPDRQTAQPFFDKANDQHHMYLILTYAGAAVITADVVFYFFKHQSIKKEKRLFESFCGNRNLSMDLQPTFELNPSGKGGNYTGLQMTFTF